MTEPIVGPGGRVGVLGGGQLGRMLALAAARLGLDVHVYDPDPDAPAARVAATSTAGAFSDKDAIAAFASNCDVVTCEFENVPAASLEAVAQQGVRIAPGPRSFAIAQDRVLEKRFLCELGAPIAPYRVVEDASACRQAALALDGACILKRARQGYDGKGQAAIAEAKDAEPAFESVGGGVCVLEKRIHFKRELSVVAARFQNGDFAAYPMSENAHAHGVLHETKAPAIASDMLRQEATSIARRIAEALDHVGVLATEFFETEDGALLVNEIAPRVHNSGHWTEGGCVCDQFEQHMRAICGWAAGDTTTNYQEVVMRNLLGDDVSLWQELMQQAGVRLSIYGKRRAGLRRKMGHVVLVTP